MNRFKKVVLLTLTLLMVLTSFQMNQSEHLSVFADEKGAYYDERINADSTSSNDEALTDTPLPEPELRDVSKSDFESYEVDGFVEDIDLREDHLKVFVKDDEEKRLYFMEPIHEWDGNEWQEIDLDFRTSRSASESLVSSTNDRTVTYDGRLVSIADDTADVFAMQTGGSHQISPSTGGFVSSYTVSENQSFAFSLAEGVEAKLNASASAIQLSRNQEVIAEVFLKQRSEALIQTAHHNEMTLQSLGNNTYAMSLGLTDALKPDTPFDIDLEVAITKSYGSGDVYLFGVRSGANFKGNSYNPGSPNGGGDNAVIGNGDYNDGYIFCTGNGVCESRNNYGIVSFFNGVPMVDIIGQNRTVSSAKLVMSYDTNPNANDGKGAQYQAFMLDPSQNYDVSNPLTITYDNFQAYLDGSASAVPFGTGATAHGYAGTLNFDITEILQSWENSGTHHGIMIKADTNAGGDFLESAHYFPNHTSAVSAQDRPHIVITTQKKAPVSADYSVNDTILNLRPFTVNKRSLNTLMFTSLGFDGVAKPGSIVSVDVKDPSGVSVYANQALGFGGYRQFPQYSQALGYQLLENTQTYYRLTSNYQLPNLLTTNKVKFNTLYKTSYQTTYNGSATAWKKSDEFLIYIR